MEEKNQDLLTAIKELIPDFDVYSQEFADIDSESSLILMLKNLERVDKKSKNDLTLFLYIVSKIYIEEWWKDMDEKIDYIKGRLLQLKFDTKIDEVKASDTDESDFFN